MNCPDCGEKLVIGSTFCECGWRDKSKPARISDPNKGRCEFVTEGRRCKLAGTYSPNTHGGGPWWCPWHTRVLDTPNSQHTKADFIEFAKYRWPKHDHENLWHQVMAFIRSENAA